jgi:porin
MQDRRPAPRDDEGPASARGATVSIAWALAWALAGSAGTARAQAPTEADAAPPAWSWGGVYKADLLHAGDTHSGLGHLNLRIDADARALLGWDDTALHAEVLWNHGGKLNRRIGTTQGISNLEVAQNAARLYAAWVEHELRSSGTSVLFGLYDLNSEFYATEASGLLIHPSFGIGFDFSQSGRNGPSIFPNLGLSLRVKQSLGGGYTLQGAAIDGVPGDPEHPGRTSVHLGRDDGALLVTEFGWQERGEAGIGPGRWGIGLWHYTQRSNRVDGRGRDRNHGVYAIAQALLVDREAGRTTGFVRAGAANRHVNAVDAGFDAGVLVEQPFGRHGPTAFTAGLAVARFGRAHRAAQAGGGLIVASNETALELGARWQPLPALAVQPLLQRVWHVGGRAGTHATIAGLRLEWTLGPAGP